MFFFSLCMLLSGIQLSAQGSPCRAHSNLLRAFQTVWVVPQEVNVPQEINARTLNVGP